MSKTRVVRNLIVEAVPRNFESYRPPRRGYNQSRLLRTRGAAAGARHFL